MRCSYARLVATLLLLGTPSAARAEGVTATLEPSEINVGDAATLSLAFDGGEPSQIALPPLPDFSVQQGIESHNVQIVNGRMASTITHSYTLFARRAGVFTIGAVQATINGHRYASAPQSLRVLHANAKQRGRDSEGFITAEVSNTSPYVGEQVVYTFRFFRRVTMSNASLSLPDFDGFVTEPLGEQREYSSVRGGQQYRVTELTRALFAQEAGKRELGPATLNAEVQVMGTGRRGARADDGFLDPFAFFGGGRREPRRLASEPIPMTIRALPGVRPPDFSGLVGSFELHAEVSRTSLHVGESTTLTVTLAGLGNLRALGTITLPEVPAFKAYDDKPELTIAPQGDTLGGRKVLKRALVALSPGPQELPSVRVVIFDPKEGAYRTLRTAPIAIQVDAAANGEETALVLTASPRGEPTAGGKTEVKVLAEDIRPNVMRLDSLRPRATTPLVARGLTASLALPPLAYLALALALRQSARRRADTRGQKSRAALRRAERALRDARRAQAQGDEHRALGLAWRALRGYLGDKLAVSGAALTAAEARALLVAAAVSPALVEHVYALLTRFENAQYGRAHAAPSDSLEPSVAVRHLLTALEHELAAGGRR